jgi:hypothetical protein
VKITTDNNMQQNAPIRREKSATDAKSSAFANVLEKTLETPATEKAPLSAAIQPVLKPSMEVPVHRVYAQTDRMIHAMERYHNLLSDTQANLRAVEPAMHQMKKELATFEPLVNEMPADHPMKQVVTETLMVAAKEIARFEGGAYVPEDE